LEKKRDSATLTAVVVVVGDEQIEAGLEELDDTVRANVACTARNENLVRHFNFINFSKSNRLDKYLRIVFFFSVLSIEFK
jgi:hypothetical protein